MDSRTLGEVIGVQAGTLNAWIQRGYVPGMSVEVSGRRRDFDIKAATRVGIIVELVRLGIDPHQTAMIAASTHTRFFPRLLIADSSVHLPSGPVEPQTFQAQQAWEVRGFNSEAELPETLAQFRGGPPSAYIVINVERITAKMQQAEKEWQRSRKTRSTRKTK